MNTKIIIKKNWIFFIFVILSCVCLIKKDNYLPMDVGPYSDTYVEFVANQGELEQTWLFEVKEIAEVSVSCIAKTTIQNEMHMRILDALTGNLVAEDSRTIDMTAEEEQRLTFTFPKTKITQGNQYTIQLSF